ncbi:HK97 family phage prohead protease [Bifidobacterium sp. YIT 13612]|uniref:HK97 family phage prohead protease n=1 Tax=Bifidobacterium sp. YIT 13612 TaxID=3383157 RepID=UPI003D347EEB
MSNEHDERLMEARTLNVTGLRLRDTGDTGDGMTLEGVAVPFNQRYALFSDYAEVIDPDCDFGTRKTVKVSREHGDLIGKLTDMRREADGLHVVAKLADTESGREAAELVREGVYDGFSIGFRPVENRVIDSDDGVTEVHRRKVDLFEVAVTGIPAYPAAEITGQRSQTTTTNNESEAPSMGNDNEQRDVNERLEAFGEELRGIKATVAAGIQTTAPAELGGEFRTAGDYLKALSDERNADHAAAIDLMRQTRDQIVTGDTGNTVAWITDDLRLIEQRRKVTNILTRDTLPATGMSMEYNVVSEDTTAAGKQTAEGAALTFGKVKFGTKTADISTYGGYTTLSRQVIDRSTTPMLNTALKALNNAYAKATENAVRTYLYDLIKSQRDATKDPNNITAPAALNTMTSDQWAGLILDAAEVMDDRNAAMTRLGVSKDVALALIKLKDSGNRFMDISGKGGDTIGAFDLTGVVGDLMRVPVYLLPKAPTSTAAFIDPTAVTVWESGGPTQLSNTDPVNIVDNYSVYGYMAVAATFTAGLLPVKFAAA